MKRTFLITALIPLLALFTAQESRADVGVAVTVGEPGFYGQIVLGDAYPAPVLVYREPVVIHRTHQHYSPVYLHVPPGHAKNWRKHCKHYDACYRPVYFVQDSWYSDVYVPTYHEHHGRKGKHKHKHRH